MPLTEAKKRSNQKYDKVHMHMMSVNWKIEEYNALKAYCEANNLTVNGFIRASVAKAIAESEK